MCSFLARAGFVDLPGLSRLHPSLSFIPISLCQREGERNHSGSPPLCRRRRLPPGEPSSTSASATISPGATARWMGHREGTHSARRVFTGMHVEGARRQCLLRLESKPRAEKTAILSEKMLGKAKHRSRGGWKRWRRTECAGLSVRKEEGRGGGNPAGAEAEHRLLMQFFFFIKKFSFPNTVSVLSSKMLTKVVCD